VGVFGGAALYFGAFHSFRGMPASGAVPYRSRVCWHIWPFASPFVNQAQLALVVTSGRGAILDEEPRANVPMLMYLRLVLALIEVRDRLPPP
jgi:hypothetical protein